MNTTSLLTISSPPEAYCQASVAGLIRILDYYFLTYCRLSIYILNEYCCNIKELRGVVG